MKLRLAVVVLVCLAHGNAHAQDLTDSNYVIDLGAGPVLGSGRIIGLGGAYTAIAEGIDGAPWNPAAYGSRVLWELDWFEWEITAGILFPGSFSGDDFFNTGESSGAVFDSSIFLSAGFRLQFGHVGFGALPRLWTYQLTSPSGELLNVNVVQMNYGIAHQFYDGQLVLGVGARTASMDLTDVDDGPLVSFTSTGVEFGALLRLADSPWRLGIASRTPVLPDQEPCNVGAPTDPGFRSCPRGTTYTPSPIPGELGTWEAGGFLLPQGVVMPSELQVGFAVQIGNRPINTRWNNPEYEQNDIRSRMTMRQHNRERAQIEREMDRNGEAVPAEDPYRWLPRRAGDSPFWRTETERRESEEELLDEWLDEAEERREQEVKDLTRLYLLISTEVIFQGPVLGTLGAENAIGVGLEGFLTQQQQLSGQEPTIGFRLGIEGEPWGDRLKLRAGTYLEPSRFGADPRIHGTGGFDLRLFAWDLFGLLDEFDLRAGVTVDYAKRFFDWGIGIGFWH